MLRAKIRKNERRKLMARAHTLPASAAEKPAGDDSNGGTLAWISVRE